MLSSLHSLCALHKIGDGFKLKGWMGQIFSETLEPEQLPSPNQCNPCSRKTIHFVINKFSLGCKLCLSSGE